MPCAQPNRSARPSRRAPLFPRPEGAGRPPADGGPHRQERPRHRPPTRCGRRSSDANADGTATAAAPNRIVFDIPGTDTEVRMIQAYRLPALTRPTIIDGYTQQGARANTLAVGDNAVLLIEVRGDGVGTSDGLVIDGGDSVIRGLVVDNFEESEILVHSDRNVIAGNFIGTDPAGECRSGRVSCSASQIFSGADNVDRRRVGRRAERHLGQQPRQRRRVGNGTNFVPSPRPRRGPSSSGNYIGTNAAGTARVEASHRSNAGVATASTWPRSERRDRHRRAVGARSKCALGQCSRHLFRLR